MSLRMLFTTLLAGAILATTALGEAKPLTILYVPLDNRPVNTTYVQQTMEAAGCRVILPPDKLIASHLDAGRPDALWSWLTDKAPKADAAVISTDALIYGGLVASRTHNLSERLLTQRVNRLNELERSLPLSLYVFSTIMRTPRVSKGKVEPAYYDTYGPQIFAYSEWADRADQHPLRFGEQIEMSFARQAVPEEFLEDWLVRRQKNFHVNEELLKLSKRHKFHFLAIGKDDNAVLSHTHMEAKHISRNGFNLPKKDFAVIDGVDQLGLLLMVRAYNEANGLNPAIYPLYSEGAGQGTLPQYSDARFQDSVPQQILASGGRVAKSANEADFLLAINSPDDGIVQDATAKSNKYYASMPNKRYIAKLMNLAQSGHKLSLADVSYSNGGDNGFMHNFALAGGLEQLIAYNAWNTADNVIGYAIAQGTLALTTPAPKLKKLIRQRLIDDWFYQSNARNRLTEKFSKLTREDLKYSLGKENGTTAAEAAQICTALCNRYSYTKGCSFTLTYPWDRLFDVEINIKK